MACSKAVLQGQSPVQCQFCEVDSEIQWKCEDCDLLLCTKCKDKIHSKVKTAEKHRVVNIKEIGTWFNQNKTQSVNNGPVSLELSIVQIQEYSTNLNRIDYIEVPMDDSLWIGSADLKKSTFFSFMIFKHLQKVKLESGNLKIISSFNIDVQDIAISQTNDLILADMSPKLKQIYPNSNIVTDSNYCVELYNAYCVHVTRDNKVVIGASVIGNGVVYVMDMNGVHQKIYQDKNNCPLFKFPRRITSTSTGTLCVIDHFLCDSLEGKLVILGPGEVISTYTGHPYINNNNQFTPTGVVSTSIENIIVTDFFNYMLHILNNTGSFLAYYNTRKIGILFPLSLAVKTIGQSSELYVGCWSGSGNEKLYKLILSEF